MFFNKKKAYKKNTTLNGKVAFANFSRSRDYVGLGRFIPYMLFEKAQYALHLMPGFQKEHYAISCGINPWNKPQGIEKHLGNYFAKNFMGGGHAFVAGGKVAEFEINKKATTPIVLPN